MQTVQRPTAAFVGASWGALLIGSSAYLIGLWNARMQLNEKGYYLTLLLFGLFAAVSLQKNVRDLGSLRAPESESKAVME